MENIQQVAKPSAMMNEAPMNHLTLSDRLKSYKRTPGSFLVMLLVVNFVYFSKWYPIY